MRTLTSVFAPGSPPLPEGLRTLTVSPSRIVEPGQTIHASFTFRNLGGGTATGFRVRFRLPEGLTYLVGTAQIDGVEIDEQGGLTTLLSSGGAKLGEVPPGGERRISVAYTVAPTIENGTQITLQAAIASFEVPVIGSNVVRLLVRSRPTLQGPHTKLSLTAVREAVPGAELQVRAHVHNSGESSAHDVMVLLPVPAHTSYVSASATVDGRPRAGLSETEPLGLTTPTIVASAVRPGATLDVVYRVRIDPVLDDATQITATGAICTQELPEFAFSPVTLNIPSKASFDGDATSFRVECEDDVVPGQRVRAVLHVRNVGTARAKNVRAVIKLPDGIAYSPGTRTIDGAPAVDGDGGRGHFVLGDVEPGRSVEVALTGVVRLPAASGADLPLEARIEWQKTQRAFTRTLTVRSGPAFPEAFNRIERETPRRLSPGDPAVCTVHLLNLGADAAVNARLQLDADEGLENMRVLDGDTELPIADDGAVHLDTLEPGAARRLRIESRIAATVEDQRQLRLRAVLRTAQLADMELGSAQQTVASRPKFDAATSKIAPESGEVLRPNRTMACRLTLHNGGTDRARDVRVRLQLPEELRLESVDRAARDAEGVVFGEVPAQESRDATVHLRLLGAVSDGDVLHINARLEGSNVVPLSLAPISLKTHAEPAFAEGASLTAIPAEAVDAGQEVVYTLALRNSGDGVARRLNARIDAPTNAVYAPGSTTVNDLSLLDFAGTSPLLVPTGLTLGDVASGAEVFVRIAAIVNTPLPPGTTIETRAHVTWDDQPELVIYAEPLRVRSAAALPIVDPSLPFSVLDAAAGPHGGNNHVRALSSGGETTYLELPPAVAVRTRRTRANELPQADVTPRDALAPASEAAHGAIGSVSDVAHDASAPVTLSLSKGEPESEDFEEADDAVRLALPLSAERVDWIVQYLERASFDSLIGHFMMIRALFPESAGAPASSAALRAYGDVQAELVDRLFLKLRLPDVQLTRNDLENRASRASLEALIDALGDEDGAGGEAPGALRLVGSVDVAVLDEAAAELERVPMYTATPWRIAASLIGTTLERDGRVVADFSAYRDELVSALRALEKLAPAEFESAVQGPAVAGLDDERRRVLRALGAHRSVSASS